MYRITNQEDSVIPPRRPIAFSGLVIERNTERLPLALPTVKIPLVSSDQGDRSEALSDQRQLVPYTHSNPVPLAQRSWMRDSVDAGTARDNGTIPGRRSSVSFIILAINHNIARYNYGLGNMLFSQLGFSNELTHPNNPLSQRNKDKLEIEILDKSTLEKCSICLECLNEVIVRLKCNHEFHKECIMLWFNINDICPMCRDKVG